MTSFTKFRLLFVACFVLVFESRPGLSVISKPLAMQHCSGWQHTKTGQSGQPLFFVGEALAWCAGLVPLACEAALLVTSRLSIDTSKDKPADYLVPHMGGELGRSRELYGRLFIFTLDDWKLASEVSSEDIEAMEAHIASEIIVEPVCAVIGKDGWINNKSYWIKAGTRVYLECCTISADGITILLYDFERAVQIERDIEDRKSRKQQKLDYVHRLKAKGAGQQCWCGHSCDFKCGCGCACGCISKKMPRNLNKKQRDELNGKNRKANEVSKSDYFNSMRDKYQPYENGAYVLKKGALAIDPATNKMYKPADPSRQL